jgi:hypothetical protein
MKRVRVRGAKALEVVEREKETGGLVAKPKPPVFATVELIVTW